MVTSLAATPALRSGRHRIHAAFGGGHVRILTARNVGIIRVAVSTALSSGALALSSGAASAQQLAEVRETEGIQEIIVTAQKTEENLQAVPVAISAFTQEELANFGITSFEGIATTSPYITFTPYSGSSNMLVLYMRGQGVIDPGQITTDSSIGLYKDGFYISRPQATSFQFGDVERVEVLRGPQGTLYGRNTTGGAINLVTRRPSGEFGFREELSFGERDQFRSLTVLDLPRWGDVAAKLSFVKSSIDGYVENIGPAEDYSEESQQAARLDLRWSASEAFVADYFFEFGELDSTPVYYENASFAGLEINGQVYPQSDDPPDETWRAIDLPLSESESQMHGLTLSWDVNDALTLRSLTGYRELEWDAYQDYANSFAGAPLFPVSFVTTDLVDSEQFSQEFQIVGEWGERLRYVGGLYFFDESASHYQNILLPDFGVSTIRDVSADSESKAAYGQVTWTPPLLDDRLELTLGGRYTEDERSAERRVVVNGTVIEDGAATGATNDQSFDRFTPAATAALQINDDLGVYAKYATGYKAGGSSETGPIGSFNQTYDPEDVTSYEIGLKSYWFDRRLRLNVAAYTSELEDAQLSLPVNPFDLSVIQGFNAGKSTADGIEVDLLVQPIDDLSLSLNYAYLDAQVDEFAAIANTIFDPALNPASPYVVGENAKGAIRMPYAAEDSFGAALDYTFLRLGSGAFSIHADYRYQSRVYLSSFSGEDVPNGDLFSVPSYGVVNARLSYEMQLPRGDQLRLTLWGRNLADEEYQAHVIASGGNALPIQIGPIVTPGGFTSQATAWAAPRQFGIEVVYEY